MRRVPKVLAVLGLVAFAFAAVAVAGAAAAKFQTNEAGTLKGKALSTQTFTTSGGSVKCTGATTSGSAASYEAEEQKVTINYSGCTAFFGAAATASSAELSLHANGTVDVLNTVTFTVTSLGCTVKVGPQKGLGLVKYTNSSGKLVEELSLSGIAYTSSGGFCGTSGSNGTYSGSNELELNEGAGFLLVLANITLSKQVSRNTIVEPCNMKKVGDICEIEFKVTSASATDGWNFFSDEWLGGDGSNRYDEMLTCKPKTVLSKTLVNCIDGLTVKKLEAGGTNKWCVNWSPPDGKIISIPFCTDLKM